MSKPHPLQSTILEITHIRVKLRHGVTDWSSCCKRNALSSGQFIHVLAFCKHIRGLLCFGLCDTCHIPHFGIKEQIFIVVALIHKEPVHSQLLKGNDIIFSGCIIQAFQSCLQGFLCFFHLFDCVTLPILRFCRFNRHLDLINLSFDDALLTFPGQWNFLELTMPDDDCIIITCSDPGTEFFPVCRFKIFFRSGKDICSRIKLQKFTCPLPGQMIRYYKQRFLGKSKPFVLHCSRRHFIRFSSPHTMCKQSIIPVKLMGNRIFLMRTQGNVGGHSRKGQMASVKFSWTVRIENFIVLFAKCLPAVCILKDPILIGFPDSFLLLACQSSFFFI